MKKETPVSIPKKTEPQKSYFIAKNLIYFLDVLLAFLIIASSRFIFSTPLGKSSLVFGLIMLFITLIFKILQRW